MRSKQLRVAPDGSGTSAGATARRCAPGRKRGFTLIELLVTISIIALLASLTVGLTSVASRKSKESRIEGELNKLVTAIESYNATFGHYPRDNPGQPTTNQLFYELSGTVFENGQFRLASGAEQISSADVQKIFKAPGFGNSVRPGEKPKFTTEFKSTQFKEISLNPDVEILVSPVPGPAQTTVYGKAIPLAIKATDGTTANPWMYDSSSPNRNNRRGFDLWTDVVIGKKTLRFSNWEKGPVVIGEE